MNYSKLALTTLLVFFSAVSFSQGVRGTIVDENGDPVPMVSIYIPSQRVGTTTNLEGQYEIALDPGEYDLVFQSLGFSRREFKLTIKKTWLDLDLTLKPQSYQLREVVINPSGEDPAYAIMRKAIAMAPYYLRQTSKYSAEVYLKGSFRMDKVPRLLRNSLHVNTNGTDVKVKEGRTYTMESVNEINFIAPDTFHHTVIASRSSFPAGDESTALGFINSSFYDPDDDMVITPLAPRAMRHYNFRYEGFFEEAGVDVNKIKVIPKRKSQQLVSGYIYIVQDLWNIHSVDFTSEMFFGDVRIRQLFQPVAENAWLPVTHQFDLDVSIMGVKAIVDYAGSVKYTEVDLNEELEAPGILSRRDESSGKKPPEEDRDEAKKEPSKSKKQQKIDELLASEDLSNREMMRLARLMESKAEKNKPVESLELTSSYKMDVKTDSVKRDTTFWERMRPVPLTLNEQQSFALNDSLAKVSENKSDTISKKEDGPLKKAMRYSLFGRQYYLADSSFTISYNGLLGLGNVNFNPVDGWNYKQSVRMQWKQDSVHSMMVQPEIVYSFARKDFMWNMELSQSYAPMKRGRFRLSAGDVTADFKPDKVAVTSLTDMVSTLMFKENYKRYFERRYVSLENGIDLSNGLRLKTNIRYDWNTPIENHTNYSFFRKEENYHFNIPENDEIGWGELQSQNSFRWRMGLTYTPRYFYRIRKGQKIMVESEYPTFFAFAEQGVPSFKSDADYLLFEGGLQKIKEADIFPALSWSASGGWFPRNNNMHFSQYKHFNASAIPVRLTSPPAFRLLDDYASSTNDWYIKGRLKYLSPYLFLKLLPVLSNRLWQESIHLDYLHTPAFHNYVQTGYSIDQIFFMGSIGVFAGFEDGAYKHWGINAVLEF